MPLTRHVKSRVPGFNKSWKMMWHSATTVAMLSWVTEKVSESNVLLGHK